MSQNGRTNKGLIGIGLFIAVAIIGSLMTFKFATVHGNELGVKETWFGGVESTPYQPGTHFLFPGWAQTIYTYDMSSQVFIMNDLPSTVEKVAKGREADAYKVQSSESQDMWISLNVRWRLDPEKIINIHKTARQHLEEKLIRPTVMLVVKNEATTRHAVEAYSGEGLVKLQTAILKDLANPEGEMAKRGIIVENFVIEGIRLDEKYIGEIRARQIATQQKMRYDEEKKAADAAADKAKSEAQADLNRRVVEANRDKQVGILKAEELAQKQVLAAEAEKKQVVLASEAEKEAGNNKAQAILAIGKAEAEAKKLNLSAYAVPGADAFVKVEISKNMAEAFKNIKGFLPGDIKVNLLTDSFMKSVETMMGQKHVEEALPKTLQPNK